MNTQTPQSTNNRIIRRNIRTMFLPSFGYAIVIGLIFMVDMLLAGYIIGKEAIAIVAIGLPCYNLFLALTNAACHGTTLRLTWLLGKGNYEGYNRAFSGGFYFSGSLSLIFLLIIQFFAKPLVIAFGGSKLPPEVFPQAMLYIRFCSPMILLFAVANSLAETAGILGKQMIRLFANGINVLSHIILSAILVLLLPAHLKVVGLGLGSSLSVVVEIVYLLIAIKVKKVNLNFKPTMLSAKEMVETMKNGLPASLDNAIDCVATGIANNILIAFFPTEPLIISIVAVVDSIKRVARMAPMGVGYAASTLFGVLYSERDKSGLKHALKEAFFFGIYVTMIWAALILLALPFLMKAYGLPGNPDVQMGSVFQLVFLLSFLLIYLLTIFYEATERFAMSLVVASIPDSLIYPLLMLLFIPFFQKTGIWLAQGGCLLVGLGVIYLVSMIRYRKFPLPMDYFLNLKPHIIKRAPMLDISVMTTDEEVVGASEHISYFLDSSGAAKRNSYAAALCTEELAVDMMEHFKEHPVKNIKDNAILDIKLFDDGDTMEIIIRSMGTSYNPLDFEPDNVSFSKVGVKLIQRIAEKIVYINVYKMNIVSIELKKQRNQ